MKKVGERNVIRKEEYIVVPWCTGSCRNNRKRILWNCRKKGGKDETKIRFTRNTLVNSLPIEKFPTRVPYNFSLDIVIGFSVSYFSSIAVLG